MQSDPSLHSLQKLNMAPFQIETVYFLNKLISCHHTFPCLIFWKSPIYQTPSSGTTCQQHSTITVAMLCFRDTAFSKLMMSQCLVVIKFSFEAGMGLYKDGWMDDLRFYVLFNSIPVISGRCSDDNERLCAMELRLRLRRFRLE